MGLTLHDPRQVDVEDAIPVEFGALVKENEVLFHRAPHPGETSHAEVADLSLGGVSFRDVALKVRGNRGSRHGFHSKQEGVNRGANLSQQLRRVGLGIPQWDRKIPPKVEQILVFADEDAYGVPRVLVGSKEGQVINAMRS